MKSGMFVSIATATIAFSEAADGNRAITQVVKMLQDMIEKSAVDAKADTEAYSKFKCYCDSNTLEKKDSVAQLESQITMLGNKIDELQGSNGELSVESAKLASEITANEQERSQAESIREKAHADWLEQEADMTQALAQMDQAIEVLAEIGGAASSLLASGQAHGKFMSGSGAQASKKADTLGKNVQEALLAAKTFLAPKDQASVNGFLQKAPFTGSYSAQSGQIVGILKQMKDTFQSNLDSAKGAEKAEKEAFTKFMETKTDSYATLKASHSEKQETLGSNDGELATKKEQIDEARASLEDASGFLSDLIPMCKEKAEEYEKRTMLRTNENAAISKAISILNSDKAFETFGAIGATSSGATGPDFLQVDETSSAAPRLAAAQVLLNAAQAQKSTRLAKVAASLSTGKNPLADVLTQIDKMFDLIDEEGREDQTQLDWCHSERADNDESYTQKVEQLSNLNTEVDTLHSSVDDPETGVERQLKDTEDSLVANRASQTTETASRREENLAYQESIKTLVEGEELLTHAIGVLQKYYESLETQKKSEEEGLMQKQQKVQKKQLAAVQKKQLVNAHQNGKQDPSEEAPDTFGEFEGQSSQGGSVIEMLNFILTETRKEETDGHASEEEAQHSYEDSMAELKSSETDLLESLAGLHKDLAAARKDLVAKESELRETERDKAAVEEYLEKIKPGCDFITENFELREEHRGKEAEALDEAYGLIEESPQFARYEAMEQENAGGAAAAALVVQRHRARRHSRVRLHE